MPTASEKRAAFRQRHDTGFFIIPNAWDAGSAVRLTGLGFKAIASTSSGAAWAAGKEDGELSRDAVLAHLAMLVTATDLPVNADFENGFADEPADVAKNVTLALGTGVAGLSIEDWSGHRMYDLGLAVERIAAARGDRGRRPERDVDWPQRELPDSGHAGVGKHRPRRRLCRGRRRLPVRAHDSRSWRHRRARRRCGAETGQCVVHQYDASIRAFADLGVRRCSIGGSLARRSWAAFDTAARSLKDFES